MYFMFPPVNQSSNLVAHLWWISIHSLYPYLSGFGITNQLGFGRSRYINLPTGLTLPEGYDSDTAFCGE